jgi:cell division protein FtsA
MAKTGHVVGIDIGTKKVTALIGAVGDDRKIEVVGIGTADSQGLRKGVVVNLDATSDAVRKAKAEAELTAGVKINAAFIGVSGSHIKSFNSRGVVAVTGKSRVISSDDMRRAIEQSKAVNIPPDREILHVIPQEYVVDEQDGIKDPLGMKGMKLEVNVHIVTGAIMLVQNLRTCVEERAGVQIEKIVLNQIATSAAVLTPDEKELGVGVIDIGAGTTEVAIFERGSLWYTSIIPIGGDNFTNDIAVGLRTAIPDAEKIKKRYGCVVAPQGEDQETVEVPSVSGRKPRVLSRQLLAEIIQPRAEEIFRLVDNDIKRMGYEKSLNSGLVLTGGTALLEGLEEVAEEIFDLPVRRGVPSGLGGLMDRVKTPDYATAVGLLLYGRDFIRETGGPKDRGRGLFSRLKDIFRED